MPLLCAHTGAHEARQQASTGWGDTQKWSLSLPPPVFLSCICFPSWRATQAAHRHAGMGVSSPSSYLFKTALQHPPCPQHAGPQPAHRWLRVKSASLPQRMHFTTQQQQPYTSTNCKPQTPTQHTEYDKCPLNYQGSALSTQTLELKNTRQLFILGKKHIIHYHISSKFHTETCPLSCYSLIGDS